MNAPACPGHVVVGVDGSPASVAALTWALVAATDGGREVTAIWVRPPALVAPATNLAVQPHGVRVPDRGEAVAELHRLVEDARRSSSGSPTVHENVIAGDPVAVLTDANREAALLVLGRTGHGRLGELVLGSVAAGCSRRADCPTVVVPMAASPNRTSAERTSRPPSAGRPASAGAPTRG